MTVEVRSDPPYAGLTIFGHGVVGGLSQDSFQEMGPAAKANAKVVARQPAFDPTGFQGDNPAHVAKYQKHMQQLEKYNAKTFGAISIFIDGLNEADMARNINTFKSNLASGHDVSAFFKGTRFGGKTTDKMNSVVASLLKLSLPGAMAVRIGVKIKWEVADVLRYAVAIRDALAASGVPQPAQGYAGAKSGLLRGFGLYKIT